MSWRGGIKYLSIRMTFHFLPEGASYRVTVKERGEVQPTAENLALKQQKNWFVNALNIRARAKRLEINVTSDRFKLSGKVTFWFKYLNRFSPNFIR